jgi:hypothetical protein
MTIRAQAARALIALLGCIRLNYRAAYHGTRQGIHRFVYERYSALHLNFSEQSPTSRISIAMFSGVSHQCGRHDTDEQLGPTGQTPSLNPFLLGKEVGGLRLPPLNSRGINLIENPTVIEMGRLRLLPSAKHVLNREQLDIRESWAVLRRRGQPRAEKMLGRNALPLICIKIFQILQRHFPRTVAIDVLIDQRYRRLSENTARGIDNFKLVLAELRERQVRLVFP